MLKPAINLYTSQPADAGFQALATLLSQERPVTMCHLSELPPPDKGRKQRLRTELIGLRALREATLDLITIAENYPARFGDELPRLRRERDSFELSIEDLQQRLAKKGEQAS